MIPKEYQETINKYSDIINTRLDEFRQVKGDDIFYEFCFCIMTPQTSAKNAWAVQNKLKAKDFFHNDFSPLALLHSKEHYIRFHNQKTERLNIAKQFFPSLLKILNSKLTDEEKRMEIKNNFSGIGMKEASHFLRNIGTSNLAIIDRHIMNNLCKCKVIDFTHTPKNDKEYLMIENKFRNFAKKIGYEMDFLDLLFFAHSTGEVLK